MEFRPGITPLILHWRQPINAHDIEHNLDRIAWRNRDHDISCRDAAAGFDKGKTEGTADPMR